jgi:soluble lytic murein transglycosylase-like protein
VTGLALVTAFLVVLLLVFTTIDNRTSLVAPTVPARAQLPDFVPAERRALDVVFQRWAREYGVPVTLMEALCWQESQWDATLVSQAGAVGVCQLSPTTADAMAAEIGDSSLSPENPSDNIRMATRYVANLIEQYQGDRPRALAAYVQGPESINTSGITLQTQAFVDAVLAVQQQFKAARSASPATTTTTVVTTTST